MVLAETLVRGYFNVVYNRAYDSTVGKLHAYQVLQERCLARCHFQSGDRVLCVGVGTGNELCRILSQNRGLKVFGVDTSTTALEAARAKARQVGHEVHLLKMDARHFGFQDQTFDKVVCIHVMDFVWDAKQATSEILRVLKPGGQFVITYPYEKEGAALGTNIVRDGLYQDFRSGRLRAAVSQLAVLAGLSFVYLPLAFRPKQRVYVTSQVTEMLQSCGAGALLVDRDEVYVDLLVSGVKGETTSNVSEAHPARRRVLLPAQRGGNLEPVLRVP